MTTYNSRRDAGGWFGPLRHLGINIPKDPSDAWVIEEQKKLGLVADGQLGMATAVARIKAWHKAQALPEAQYTHNISKKEMVDGKQPPAKLENNMWFLAAVAQTIRDRVWGQAVEIVSGYRDPQLNVACGGAPKSKHMNAEAIDIRLAGAAMTVDQMNAAANKIWSMVRLAELPAGAIIGYPKKAKPWVHYDFRGANFHDDWVKQT